MLGMFVVKWMRYIDEGQHWHEGCESKRADCVRVSLSPSVRDEVCLMAGVKSRFGHKGGKKDTNRNDTSCLETKAKKTQNPQGCACYGDATPRLAFVPPSERAGDVSHSRDFPRRRHYRPRIASSSIYFAGAR